MTVDKAQQALLKVGGDDCAVSVSVHRFAGQDAQHRYESETWSGSIRVKLEGDDVTATIGGAMSGELLVMQLKAKLRDELHRKTFARKQARLESPRPRLTQVLCLEHRP